MALPKRKSFIYKIYSSAGVYLKTWSDEVYSVPAFSSILNEGFSELVVEIARSAINFGEDSDVKYNNQLKVYAVDDENGLTGGTLIFSGYCSGYVPSIIGRDETLKVSFLSYWQELNRIVIEDNNSNYTLTPDPQYKANIAPEMFSNAIPAPYAASASTDAGTGFQAFLAFDTDISTKWKASTTTGWLQMDFGGVISPVINKYAITAEDNTEVPKTWTLKASTTGAYAGEEVTLDTQTNVTAWTTGERKEFEFSNSTAYRYYRLNITANNGSGSAVSVQKLELFQAYTRTGATSIRYSVKDPSNMLKDLLDRFTAAGGKLDYNASIDLTGTTATYTFENMTYQEAAKKIAEMCPAGWYIRVGADDILYLKNKSSTADHKFILGQHITEYEPQKHIENLVNRIFFYAGDPGTGERLFKKYTRSSSISTYGTWDQRISDERVKLTSTMDEIAGRILDNFDTPEIRVVIKILDSNNEQGKGYDIETIKVGQTCKIMNATKNAEEMWDIAVWDISPWDYSITNAAAILLQIQKVEYHPDYVILELSNRQPDIARRVEQINQKVIEQQVADSPVIPTT